MCKLKIISIVGVTLFSFLAGQAQSGDLSPYPFTVTSSYKVEVEAPFFSKAGQWKFWGLAPDSLILYEDIRPNDRGETFSILLVDDDGTIWVELYSDITKRSIVKLPDDTVKTMGIDGVKFIGSLLKFFTDSEQHYLSGKVTLGGDSFNARAIDLGSSNPNTRRFLVRTYDDDETYIEGEVLTEFKDGVMFYRGVDVFVKRSKLQLRLILLNTTTR